uniref:Sarcolamban A n=1 Tax=Drosophila melanogaster TaxID=7227 RepID=SLCA_DROME|nr:sarcolamban A, isoform A [Drosophila melanogaster]NP_001285995.1 sarcolamban A, isoform B [Drosophila melanogaster]NP_001285996.1 sarcolamban A, isoform C [Drosophila melanogaster]C0HJH4.1 RecName: Full=Sarcolamban A [Drosophila melanogaster]AHN54508.1 sarcolamban A, isoform A [Drosophila melanogaster]AHN54509.1 sarcolamban A, isoform B [Drosophila melanogaster]AHN54510.1 sarcolamban A, isoform C [Drosophila melanogaster]|eukprot:NP_001285994.1 sarcolamban A, isoform A [Drosophila melanogaster]
MSEARNLFTTFGILAILLFFLYLIYAVL